MSKYKISVADFLMFVLITISFFFISESIASENCLPENAIEKPVLVQYEITTSVGNAKEKNSLTIVRSGNRVAYSRDGLTEVWEKTSNDQIKLYKYFNQHKRGIEYQPIDIVNSEQIDWLAKRQLVSENFLNQFMLVKQKNKNCKQYHLYQAKTNDEKQLKINNKNRKESIEKLKIVWLSNLRLPESMQHRRDNVKMSWKLVGLENQLDKITDYLQKLDNYPLIDYSDIGDNESDPFLQKMINLGFVAHSDPFYYSGKNGIYKNSSEPHVHAH
jgi:hypothetical protein